MSDDLLDRIEEQADLAAGLAPFASDALKDAADEIRRLRIVEERLSKRVRNESDRPEAIAWAVIESGECHPLALFTSRADSELHASRKNDIGQRNCEAVPLYRSPPVSSSDTFSDARNSGESGKPTLTDEEREAIRWFAGYGDLQAEARRAEVLLGLLRRLG
jgi:hypothetical protein